MSFSSLLTRKSIVQLTTNMFVRAAEKKPTAGAGGKKKPGAKKKRFDRGPEPLKLENVAPTIMCGEVPGEADSEYPDWLFEIDDQLPRDKPIKLLKPEDGKRFFKQQNRQAIKRHNGIMLMTKGRGI